MDKSEKKIIKLDCPKEECVHYEPFRVTPKDYICYCYKACLRDFSTTNLRTPDQCELRKGDQK